MADFLTRLAARALNRAPRVMPDLVSEIAGRSRSEALSDVHSSFDPVVATGVPPSHESATPQPRATTSSEREDSRAMDPRRRDAASRETVAASPRADGHRDMAPLVRLWDPSVRRAPSVDEGRSIVPATFRERTSERVGTSKNVDRSDATASRSVSAPDVDGGVSPRPAAHLAPLVPTSSTEPLREALAVPPRTPRGDVPSHSSSGTPSIAVPPPATHPTSRPAQSSAVGDGVVSPSVSTPTTVRVTIGRIEVRSVPAPGDRSPARPSASQRRTIALDAYLKQRSEGRS